MKVNIENYTRIPIMNNKNRLMAMKMTIGNLKEYK